MLQVSKDIKIRADLNGCGKVCSKLNQDNNETVKLRTQSILHQLV